MLSGGPKIWGDFVSDIILDIKNLRTGFDTDDGSVVAVDDVSFQLRKGETLGIVGESGCGKSVTSLSIMRLIPMPPGKNLGGQVLYNGTDLLKLSDAEMRKIRGNEISMIFQEPMTSLNPVFTVGDQIGETVALHQNLPKEKVRKKAIEMLDLVGIPEPHIRVDNYPHELSGGMRQRVMIAIALSCNPNILIADEPTTALDVTIQAQILELINQLQKDLGTAVIMITHDLGVVAEVCDEVAVMYAGRIIEYGGVEDIFYRPRHQYTRGLLDSIPDFESGKKLKHLNTIPGMVPSLFNLPQGCRFADRCSAAKPDCKDNYPDLTHFEGIHKAACYYPVSNEVRP